MVLLGRARARRAIATTLVLLTLVAATRLCAQEDGALKRYEYSAEKLGSPTRIIFYAASDAQAQEAADAVWERFDKIDDSLSDWRPESELIQVCRAFETSEEPREISEDFRNVLAISRVLCEQTNRAFDPTVGPIVKLWRRSLYFHDRPPQKNLDIAKSCVGLDVWRLDERGVWMKKGVRFDFGGIAKGYALDKALETLQSHGIESALIDASGDLRIGAAPPGTSGWRVGVSSLNKEPAFYCELTNVGIASSGDANRYVEIDGVRYSHIVDPRTGEPMTRRCVATVMAPNATLADALASALCVLGVQECGVIDQLAKRGIEGEPFGVWEYLLYQAHEDANAPYDESNVDMVATPGFAKLELTTRAQKTEQELEPQVKE